MKVTTFGLDLAKHVFQLHWVEPETGEVRRKALKRDQMMKFFVQRAPSVVAMEACGSAHYWARKLIGLGHEVRLIAAQFVRPYVKRNKTDAADAQAIWEAVQRPEMRFVAVKDEHQQAVLTLHRMREQLVKMRTMQIIKNGRQFAAFLGLVPRQAGTGGKVRLFGISKRGDTYLRKLLIHGARSVITHQKARAPWLEQLLARRPFNAAVVALANKMARTIWALLAHDRTYQNGVTAQAA